MADAFNLPPSARAPTIEIIGPSTAASTSLWESYQVPRWATWLHLIIVGSGTAGTQGNIASDSVGAYGGAGGNSGGMTTLLIPATMLPQTLWIGLYSTGNSYICDSYLGTSAAIISSAGLGAYALAGASSYTAPLTGGSSPNNAAGTSVSIGSIISAGAGGAGNGVGGSVVSTLQGVPTIAGGFAGSGGNGSPGVRCYRPRIYSGGAGGGSLGFSGGGGSGGEGMPGCGGGGGGFDNNNVRRLGGIGGPAFSLITAQ